MLRRHRMLSLAFSVLLGLCLLALSQTGSAQAASRNQAHGTPVATHSTIHVLPAAGKTTSAAIPHAFGGYYSLRHVFIAGESDVAIYTIQIYPGTTGTISKTYSLSNSYSANVGVTADVVSAGVGFSVTQTYSLTASCSYNNTTSQVHYLTLYDIYRTWDYDVYWNPWFQTAYKVGFGEAEQFQYTSCFVA